jgi:hypothetical protein
MRGSRRVPFVVVLATAAWEPLFSSTLLSFFWSLSTELMMTCSSLATDSSTSGTRRFHNDGRPSWIMPPWRRSAARSGSRMRKNGPQGRHNETSIGRAGRVAGRPRYYYRPKAPSIGQSFAWRNSSNRVDNTGVTGRFALRSQDAQPQPKLCM